MVITKNLMNLVGFWVPLLVFYGHKLVKIPGKLLIITGTRHTWITLGQA